MKQQKNKPRARKKKAPNSQTPQTPKTVDRRNALGVIRNWGLFAAVGAAGGWYLIDEVLATMSEQDLTKIGNGTPTVVQIHDPQCSRCLALQREARKAMKAFGGNELQYLVANIRSEKGRALASANGVGHITLLLFDAKGQRRETLHGNSHSDYLELMFRKHVDQHSGKSS